MKKKKPPFGWVALVSTLTACVAYCFSSTFANPTVNRLSRRTRTATSKTTTNRLVSIGKILFPEKEY
jgi:hypothetical protein